MRDHEEAMKVYVQLAVVADEKHQPMVRDRFMLLSAVEACRAGWPEVAARCRERLIATNPVHQASRHPTMANALRDAEFQQLVVQHERYCPFEKAEAMLRQLNLPPLEPMDGTNGEQMLQLLDESPE
jgi:hypothetical protein